MNVMLVDDYPLILQGLKASYDWAGTGFPVVAEAYNGEEALAILEQQSIDILLTDIRMPVMDGLELIRNVRQRFPQIHIAVLSAYDDFQLVRNAFQLGAENYLLKQELDEEAIRCLLEKFAVAKKIENGRAFLTGDAKNYQILLKKKEKLENALTQGIEEQRDAFFRDLLQKNAVPEPNRLKQLGLALPQHMALMQFVIEMTDTADDAEMIFLSLEREFRKTVEEQLHGHLFRTNYNEYSFIFDAAAGENFRKAAEGVYYFVQDYLQHQFYSILTAAVSLPGKQEDLPALFLQARQTCQRRFLYGKGKLLFYSDLPQETGHAFTNSSEYAEKFGQMLRNHNLKEILSLQAKLLESVNRTENETDILFIRMVWEIVRLVDEQNLSMSCDRLLAEMQFLLSEGSIRERDEWLGEVVCQVLSTRESQGQYVSLFRQCVEKHYAESCLRAETVAQYLGLSVGRMGKVLFQETGFHFADYLNAYRIEQAKKLLTETTLKVYEVAERTGYGNVEHFTRMFKKITGVSPTVYANRSSR